MIRIKKLEALREKEIRLIFEAFISKWSRMIRSCHFQQFYQLYMELDQTEQVYGVFVQDELAGVFGLSGSFVEPIQKRKKSFGLKNWRWYLGIKMLEESIPPNDCYLSFIAIAKKYRGKGIGHRCLAFIEEFAVEQPEITTVSLMVAVDNKKAVALYKNKGFKVIKQLDSWLTRGFLGERSWLKMIKELD